MSKNLDDLTFDDVMIYLQKKYNENEEIIKKLDKQLVIKDEVESLQND